MQKVIIASKNPVKINATKEAFSKMFPDERFDFIGIAASSKVSDQPMSSNETLQGARNRAFEAKLKGNTADYFVGIEGGIEVEGNQMSAFAWIYIVHNHKESRARTANFYLPPKVCELIQEGLELGEADDKVFGQSNSKQKNGAVGLLTGNLIDRTSYYFQAIVLALIPFRNPELY